MSLLQPFTTEYCTVGMIGLHSFAANFNVSGLGSPTWERLVHKHLLSDRVNYKGVVTRHNWNEVFFLAHFSMLC